MKTLLAVIAAFVIGLVVILETAGPASAVRTWTYWPHSGYCLPGTCNSSGGWKTRNVKFCKPRPNCRWGQQ